MNELNGGYYDERYFDWQRKIGEFGGKANLFKFEPYISGEEDILDFGCGGGYLLKNIITTGTKLGVEINPAAAQIAAQNGVEKVYSSIYEVPDNAVDVVISNHVLEHVDNPVEIMMEIKRVLRVGGSLIVVVPHETRHEVNEKDINMHLYTWSPQNLVNMFKKCGFDVKRYGCIKHCWMDNYMQIQKLFGWAGFHRLCKLYSRVRRKGFQTYCSGVRVE